MRKIILLIISVFVTLNFVSAQYYTDNLYVVGNGCDANWSPGDALAMTKVSEGVFTWTGNLYKPTTSGSNGERFKFIVARDWHPSITCRLDVNGHLKLNMDEETDLYVRWNGDDGYDNAFQVPENGIYKLDVDLNEMKVTCSVAGEIVLPTPDMFSLYLTGSALSPDGVWNHESPTEMTILAEGLFTWTGNLYNHSSGKQFKFMNEAGTWDKTICAKLGNDTPIYPGGEFDLHFRPAELSPNDYKFVVTEAGEYTIKVDLKAMKMWVTSGSVQPPSPDLYTLYINGSALSPEGQWEHDAPSPMTLVSAGIFTWTGDLYNHPSGNEFKFRNELTWNKTICAAAEATPIAPGEFDLVFRPFESSPNDYKFIVTSPGEYTLTVNLNTMKMTVNDEVTIMDTNNKSLYELQIVGKKVIILNNNNNIQSAGIFDITGKQLNFVANIQNSVTLADHLAAGIYIVKMNSGNRNNIQKIIIK